MTEPTLLWAYGIVGADAGDAAADAPPGIGGAPVRLVTQGAVSAIVSAIPAAGFDAATIERRLTELEWVGARGQEHERVLTHFADRVTTVPFSPFSLHADEGRLRARLVEQEETLRRSLARLHGRRQWGVRVWREREPHARAVAQRSPAVAALDRELAAATPGRRYLLEKKRTALVTDEGARLMRAHLEEELAALRGCADAVRTLPLVRAAGDGPQLVLDAMFLVAEARYEPFQAGVSAGATRGAELGARWEFTGPWPCYHFADE